MALESINNNRIAKNTILLYMRMVLLMVVSLYTSRQILVALGNVDYGLYNVVSGVIIFLSLINGVISGSTARYITFAIGKNDPDWLKSVFTTCLQSHIAVSVIIFIIAETIGLWFIENKLVIPADKTDAIFWVYQCSIMSTLIMIWTIPYNSCIIAHERMSAFAGLSVLEAFFKLIIVFVLLHVDNNRLVIYGILLLCVQIFISSSYVVYGLKHFEESKPKIVFFEKNLFKETLAFSGWSIWGGLASALFTQGLNFLLNIFFGPIVNTARGLAVTVQTSVLQLASNFQTAINPQITKSYASDHISEMHTLIIRSSKFTFILLYCLCLPLLLKTEFVLNLWLAEIPPHTASFVRIMLCICLVDAVANPFITAIGATGKIKKTQIVVAGVLLSIVPLSYICLKLGGKPISVFYIQFIVFIAAFICRMKIASSLINLSIKEYVTKAIVPSFIVILLSLVICLPLWYIVDSSTLSSIFLMTFSVVLVLFLSYCIVLAKNERYFVKDKIGTLVLRIK